MYGVERHSEPAAIIYKSSPIPPPPPSSFFSAPSSPTDTQVTHTLLHQTKPKTHTKLLSKAPQAQNPPTTSNVAALAACPSGPFRPGSQCGGDCIDALRCSKNAAGDSSNHVVRVQASQIAVLSFFFFFFASPTSLSRSPSSIAKCLCVPRLRWNEGCPIESRGVKGDGWALWVLVGQDHDMSNPSLSLPPMLIEQDVRVPSPLRGHALLAYHTFLKQELPRGG